jgi:hypothetical protein
MGTVSFNLTDCSYGPRQDLLTFYEDGQYIRLTVERNYWKQSTTFTWETAFNFNKTSHSKTFASAPMDINVRLTHQASTLTLFLGSDSWTIITWNNFKPFLIIGAALGSGGSGGHPFFGDVTGLRFYNYDTVYRHGVVPASIYTKGGIHYSGMVNMSTNGTIFSFSDTNDTDSGESIVLKHHQESVVLSATACQHSRRLHTQSFRLVQTGQCVGGTEVSAWDLRDCARRSESKRFSFQVRGKRCVIHSNCEQIKHVAGPWFTWDKK